jgi:hypothetical protein
VTSSHCLGLVACDLIDIGVSTHDNLKSHTVVQVPRTEARAPEGDDVHCGSVSGEILRVESGAYHRSELGARSQAQSLACEHGRKRSDP